MTLIGSEIGPPVATQPDSLAISTMLGGTRVLFDGNIARLLYAGPSQVNAIVPFEVSSKDVTNILIENVGQVAARFPFSMSVATPAIFTSNGSGVRPGARLNENLTWDSPSEPVSPGSIVILYADGSTTPVLQDGRAAGSSLSYTNRRVSVQVEGIRSESCMREARRSFGRAETASVSGTRRNNLKPEQCCIVGSLDVH